MTVTQDLYVYRALSALILWEEGRLSEDTMRQEIAAFWAADEAYEATHTHNKGE